MRFCHSSRLIQWRPREAFFDVFYDKWVFEIICDFRVINLSKKSMNPFWLQRTVFRYRGNLSILSKHASKCRSCHKHAVAMFARSGGYRAGEEKTLIIIEGLGLHSSVSVECWHITDLCTPRRFPHRPGEDGCHGSRINHSGVTSTAIVFYFRGKQFGLA